LKEELESLRKENKQLKAAMEDLMQKTEAQRHVTSEKSKLQQKRFTDLVKSIQNHQEMNMKKFEQDTLRKLQGKNHQERLHQMEKQLDTLSSNLRNFRQMKIERDYYHKQYNQAMSHIDQMREEIKEQAAERLLMQ